MATSDPLDLDSDDSSDEDYVPEKDKNNDHPPSEVDSSGDDEENHGAAKKRTKTTPKQAKKLKTSEPPVTPPPEEAKQKSADDVWASFMKDTGFVSRSQAVASRPRPVEEPKPVAVAKPLPQTVKVTEVFEFAGEEVVVEKQVPVVSPLPGNSTKKGGLGSVLAQLGKKQKISTLEKTKLDWDKYKSDENLKEELETHNKGKDGYLERQDFLQRADLRRFEIEKEIRSVARSKRLN